MELKKYSCNEIKEIRIHGRVSNRKTDGIPLFWTASAIEFDVIGSEMWLEYYCEYNGNTAYMRVEIDGADMYRFMLEEGRHKVCIFKQFPYEKKNVRIYREIHASSAVIVLESLYTDGEFSPLPERKYKIEFFGDSVTSGEGLAGARCLNTWIPAVFSCRGNYALLVANELDADWSVFSQSGWGYSMDWTGCTDNAIPKYYDYVCGVTSHPSQLALGSGETHDFEADRTNVAVINLGANDISGLQRDLSEDKKIDPAYLKLFCDAVYDFIADIRKHNKNTVILCC